MPSWNCVAVEWREADGAGSGGSWLQWGRRGMRWLQGAAAGCSGAGMVGAGMVRGDRAAATWQWE